jgi:hypothetical protein
MESHIANSTHDRSAASSIVRQRHPDLDLFSCGVCDVTSGDWREASASVARPLEPRMNSSSDSAPPVGNVVAHISFACCRRATNSSQSRGKKPTPYWGAEHE